MKRTIYIMMAALSGMVCMPEADAQEAKDIIPGVSINNFSMEREGKFLNVAMDIDLKDLDVSSNCVVLLTPRLVNGIDSLDLPSVGIYGRRRYYYYVRNGIGGISGDDEKVYRASEKPDDIATATSPSTATGWTEPRSSSTAAISAAATICWLNTTVSWAVTTKPSSLR